MTTIHDLPVELLCEIFQMVQGRWLQPHPSASFACYRGRLRILVLLSLVCKSWRGVALGCGVLWSSIPVNTSQVGCLKLISIMTKRSNGTPLELSVHVGTDPSAPGRVRRLVKVLTANNHRIGALHLDTNPRHVAGDDGLRLLEATDSTITVINFILTAPFPTPQHSCGLLRNLRTLSLSLPPFTVVVNISALLKTIESSTELEILRFVSLHPVHKDCPSTYAIHVPKLRRFCLRACDSAMILSHITTPKTSTINVVMNSSKARGCPSGSHILVALPRSLTNMRALESADRLVMIENEMRGEFRLGLSSLRSETALLVVTNGRRSLERFILRSLRAIAVDPYFGAIQSLAFSCNSCAPVPWSTVLIRFVSLLELNISSRHGMDVMYALLSTMLDGSPLCPSLRRIRFYTGPGHTDHDFDPLIFSAFRKFRLEHRCSVVKITARRANGRVEEL